MVPGAPEVDSPQDDSLIVPEIRRERVVVRRRRARNHRHKHVAWTARASRRRAVRAIVVCTGVLVLMALGLYYGLSRQAIAPEESSHVIALSAHHA
jgi:transcriptional regulator GlxA family with amidase domain